MVMGVPQILLIIIAVNLMAAHREIMANRLLNACVIAPLSILMSFKTQMSAKEKYLLE
jgi:hypothetical protein